ncbi:short chain dehydrogenase [Plectosphaerella cucumerina]|uniref:Short chain dehydrogenase n=1 Tax=Plectosphaerella cucumerina TaxID=40658 RepID=A0A8K0X9N6_9PEZI|nr:short chain dehydrogenase [Plectosphaerella cucumerina]
MSSLSGKTVIVTGSGAGLGRVIAKTYLEAGANVAICDISEDRVKSTAAEFEPSHAGRVHSAVVDVADEASVASLLTSTVSAFGRVDVLVNNAGIMDSFDGVATLTKATWDRVMGVNALGPFLASRAAVNQFLAQEGEAAGGIIINISSSASIRGTAAGAAYTASKHALVGLTKNTAGHYGPRGIYAVALSLGGMPNTEIAKSQPPETFNMEGFGVMRTTLPGFDPETNAVALEDVAKYCVFLSDRSIAATANGSNIVFNKNWPTA